jgi:gas vesicle protein
MRHDERDDDRYVVIEQQSAGIGTFLLGLAIGAGAAILFAPRSGEDTRRMIGDRARDAGTKARQVLDEATATMQDKLMDMRGDVEERFGDASRAVNRRRRQMEHAFDAGRSAAQEARRELERKLAEYRAEDEASVARAGRDARVSAHEATRTILRDGDEFHRHDDESA